MSVHVPAEHEIETASGRYVDLLAPQPETIVLDDIAHGLAHTCRFAGQTSRFYSVAEHAVHVSHLLRSGLDRPDLALAGLHHDDAEAYLGDVTRPLKALLGSGYVDASVKMDMAISAALGLATDSRYRSQPVKLADDLMLAFEASELLPSKGEGWGYVLPDIGQICRAARPTIWCCSPGTAKKVWLETHSELAA